MESRKTHAGPTGTLYTFETEEFAIVIKKFNKKNQLNFLTDWEPIHNCRRFQILMNRVISNTSIWYFWCLRSQEYLTIRIGGYKIPYTITSSSSVNSFKTWNLNVFWPVDYEQLFKIRYLFFSIFTALSCRHSIIYKL